jgi:hypothetical protein
MLENQITLSIERDLTISVLDRGGTEHEVNEVEVDGEYLSVQITPIDLEDLLSRVDVIDEDLADYEVSDWSLDDDVLSVKIARAPGSEVNEVSVLDQFGTKHTVKSFDLNENDGSVLVFLEIDPGNFLNNLLSDSQRKLAATRKELDDLKQEMASNSQPKLKIDGRARVLINEPNDSRLLKGTIVVIKDRRMDGAYRVKAIDTQECSWDIHPNHLEALPQEEALPQAAATA